LAADFILRAKDKRVAIALGVVIALLCALIIAGGPKHNWDMIPYVGCAYDLIGDGDPAALQAQTYRTVQQATSADVYRELTDPVGWANQYRPTMARDPDAFADTMPVYCFKIAYTGAIAALASLGVDPVGASFWISAICALATMVILGVWLMRRLGRVAPVILALAVFGGLFQTARYSTPDAMLALTIVGGLISFAQGRDRLAACLFTLALLVRLDAIIYLGLYLALWWIAILRPPLSAGQGAFARSMILPGVFGITGLIIYGAIQAAFDPPGYAAVFVHSFIANIVYLGSANPPLDIATYFDVLGQRGLDVLSRGIKLPGLIGLSLLGLVMAWRGGDVQARRCAMAAGLGLVAMTVHFIIFPWFSTRYYAGHLAMMTAGSLVVLWPVLIRWWEGRKRRQGI
jgi:hypothetical protein